MVMVIISGPWPRQVWLPPLYTEGWCFFGWHTKLAIDLAGCAHHIPDGHVLSHPSSTHTSSLLHTCQYVPFWLFASLMQVCVCSHLSLKFTQASLFWTCQGHAGARDLIVPIFTI